MTVTEQVRIDGEFGRLDVLANNADIVVEWGVADRVSWPPSASRQK